MQGVILAAGKGTRLHPITATRTKAMAPVAGKPIVARVLDTLIANGICDFTMIISPDDEDIRHYFTERSHLPADVQVRFEVQNERLGMAHALSLAVPYIQEDFILSACDNLTPPEHIAELIQIHRSQHVHATLSLMEVGPEQLRKSGVVDVRDGRVHGIVEKPAPGEEPSNIASLPLYLFSTKLLEFLPRVQPSKRGEYELQDAIQMLIKSEGPIAGVFTPTRLQLTNAADLLFLNQHYLAQENGRLRAQPDKVGSNTQLIGPLHFDDGVTIGENCVVGPNVYLEAGCYIGNYVELRNAIVLRNRNVADHSQVIEQVIA
ncbi:MAG: NTP transferase domain-containing protein [Caldilineaceae bacterium]|nr:NTP transferase domain-containing protein [Caldilineaceae bacterium]